MLSLDEQDEVRRVYAKVQALLEPLNRDQRHVLVTAASAEFGEPRGAGGWVARGIMEVVDAPPALEANGRAEVKGSMDVL